MDAPSESTPLTWCSDCRKLTALHPLVHQIHEHAPRIGDRRRTNQWNWRTAELREAS